jgi:uncharacterized protein YjbI with pentapeptide repeats
MLGLLYETCNPFNFSVSFKGCKLNHSSFYKVRLKKITFLTCDLSETDLEQADLSEAKLDMCKLNGAKFYRTNLAKADLRTTQGFEIDPEHNNIKKAKFSTGGLPGLLLKYDIQITY